MPKLVDHDERRKEIAAAALVVIDRAGLDGARLRDVAEAAAVTTGAVTHYFDGKDAVLEAALAGLVDRILDQQDEARASGAGLVDLCMAYMPVDEESRRGWRVWLAYWGRAMTEPRLMAQHKRYYDQISARLAEQVKRANPRLSGGAAKKAASAIIAAVDGVGVRATLEPEDWPARRQKDTLKLLLAAFEADNPSEDRRHA